MPDFSPDYREKLADKGQAMPSGAFPIRNRADLKRAIQAFGRAKDPEKTKLWICKRAKELNAMDLIPKKWLDEKGVVTHMDDVEDFLAHYGVLGMHWGVRKDPDGPSRNIDRANIYRKRIEELKAKKPFNRAQRMAINAEITALALKEKQARNVAALGRKARVAAAARDAKKSDDHKITRERLAKKPRELSNKELQEVNNRLQMEKKLRELRRENTKIKQGNDHIKAILAIGGTAVGIYAALNKTAAGQRLIDLGKSWIRKKNPLAVFAR